MKRLFPSPDILPAGAPHKDFFGAPASSNVVETGIAPSASAARPAARVADAGGKAPAFGALQKVAVTHGPSSLAFWSAHYLTDKVLGCSPNTLDAKSRDLLAFVRWFSDAAGTADIRVWRPRDTRDYLNHLKGQLRAATTINRAFATLRHFARWAQDNHGVFGAMGLPTVDVQELAVEDPPCKKLERHELRAIFKAAEDRVRWLDKDRADALEDGRPNPTRRRRPRRDLAMLALLYFTGLRATELVMLRRDQFDGTHLNNVARKGRLSFAFE